jgi:hypothetical protein
MKKLLLIPMMLFASLTYGQTCYTVKNVENLAKIENINPKRFTLGVKQITEEILSENYSICDDGSSVSVIIKSIEAPTNSISFGPFEKKRKVTVVTVDLVINGKVYVGIGESKTDVKSTFIELQDENIPFEKSAFSAALKKSLINAVKQL